MMWYKNIKLILDSLRILRSNGVSFKAFMVGDGYDAAEIKKYAKKLLLGDSVVFTGAIYNREDLRVYYSAADLFLFPSTYDTSGIVVKEAAACNCPTLLVHGSCASEGVVHDFTGFLADENANSCAIAMLRACKSREHLAQIGENCGKHIYLSWDTAVKNAYNRYEEILRVWPAKLPYNSKA